MLSTMVLILVMLSERNHGIWILYSWMEIKWLFFKVLGQRVVCLCYRKMALFWLVLRDLSLLLPLDLLRLRLCAKLAYWLKLYCSLTSLL